MYLMKHCHIIPTKAKKACSKTEAWQKRFSGPYCEMGGATTSDMVGDLWLDGKRRL